MRRLFRILQSIFAQWTNPKYKSEYHEDVPDNVIKNIIYVIGKQNQPWCVILKCPCKCGENIQLNLLDEGYPKWRITRDKRNRITIFPSIRRTWLCKSHFHIRNGRVYWAHTTFRWHGRND